MLRKKAGGEINFPDPLQLLKHLVQYVEELVVVRKLSFHLPPPPTLAHKEKQNAENNFCLLIKGAGIFAFLLFCLLRKSCYVATAGLKLKGFFHLGLQRSWVLSELKAFTTMLAQDYF